MLFFMNPNTVFYPYSIMQLLYIKIHILTPGSVSELTKTLILCVSHGVKIHIITPGSVSELTKTLNLCVSHGLIITFRSL